MAERRALERGETRDDAATAREAYESFLTAWFGSPGAEGFPADTPQATAQTIPRPPVSPLYCVTCGAARWTYRESESLVRRGGTLFTEHWCTTVCAVCGGVAGADCVAIAAVDERRGRRGDSRS